MKFIRYQNTDGLICLQVVVIPEDIKKLKAIFPIAPSPTDRNSKRAYMEKDGAKKEDDEDDMDDKAALKALLAGNRYTKELDSGHPSRVEWLERSEVLLMRRTTKARSAMSQTKKDTIEMLSSATPLLAILCAVGSRGDFGLPNEYLCDMMDGVWNVTRALAKVDVEERDVAQLARSIFKLAIRIVAKCQKRYLDS